LYPRTVSTPIDEASLSLIFRKIPVMVRCIITGWERGEGFVQLGLPCTLPGYPPPLCMSTQSTASKTPLRRIRRFLIAKVLRVEERSEKRTASSRGGGGYLARGVATQIY
jgi:hypothetical protein